MSIAPFTYKYFVVCQRQGRSDTYATEFDLEAEEYVPLPKGDVHKKKEVIQDVTLHDLDVANARPQVPRIQFVACRLIFIIIIVQRLTRRVSVIRMTNRSSCGIWSIVQSNVVVRLGH